MDTSFRRYLVGAAILIFLVPVLSQPAADTVITGRVLTDGGNVATLAKVEVYDNATRLTLVPEPVDLQGRFRITLRGFDGTHLTCRIFGNGYKPLRLTFVINGSVLDVGNIVVERTRPLQIGEATHSVAADGTAQSIDLFLGTQPGASARIRRVGFTGARKAETHCLEGAPSFIVELKQQKNSEQWLAFIEDPQANWKESILVSGQVDLLPCDQIRANFYLDTSFEARGDSQQKFRLRLPRTITTSNGKVTTVDLEAWESLHVAFTLDDGTVVQRSLKEIRRGKP